MNKFFTTLSLSIFMCASSIAMADAPVKSNGEVRKIDKAAGKVTIKHGPLVNLDMPPMTMVFKASEPAALDKLQVGDHVQFVAGESKGTLTASDIEVAK